MATIPTNNKQPQSARTPFSQTILNSNGYQNILKSYGNGTNAPKKEPPKKEQPKKEPPKKEPKKELTEAEKERAWKKK